MQTIAWTVCAAALALAPQTFAQTDTKEQPKPTPKPAAMESAPFVKLSKIVDLDLKTDADKSVGEIDAVLVDPSNGAIVYALVGQGGVLGIGEKEHMVPWEQVRILPKEKDEDACVARTSLTKEQVERAPVFKKNVPVDAEAERAARTAAGLSGDGVVARGPSSMLVASNEIEKADVRGSDDKEVGKLDELVVAPKEGAIAYVVLGAGGVLGIGEKRLALPWAVIETTWDKDKKLMLRTPITKDRLVQGPTFDDKEWKRLRTREYVTDLCKYYSVEPFWNRTVKASSPKPPTNN